MALVERIEEKEIKKERGGVIERLIKEEKKSKKKREDRGERSVPSKVVKMVPVACGGVGEEEQSVGEEGRWYSVVGEKE